MTLPCIWVRAIQGMDELKDFYKTFLHTESGKTQMNNCMGIMRKHHGKRRTPDVFLSDWISSPYNTNNVKNNWKKIPTCFTDKLVLTKIVPIGIPLNCFNNTKVFTQIGFERRLGFTTTCCPCATTCLMELHSVNYKDGVYYDFTKDFCNETEKFFYPIENETMNEQVYTKMLNKSQLSIIFKGKKKCSCSPIANANVAEFHYGYEKFVEDKESLFKIRFYGF